MGGIPTPEAARAVAEAARALTGWQPIETAPKDTRRMLLFLGNERYAYMAGLGIAAHFVAVGCWDIEKRRWALAHGGEPLDPTHWHSLPPMPEVG